MPGAERIGRTFGPIVAWDEVNTAMVRQWREVFGYPASRDEDVPLAMLQVWTMPGYGGVHAPGSSDTDAWDVLNILANHGFTKAVGIRSQQRFYRRPCIGDRLRYSSHVGTISALKRTALGDGHFVTVHYQFTDQRARPAGTMEFTMLVACPRASNGHSDAMASATNMPDIRGGASDDNVSKDYPTLHLPVSTTSIVASAIATRDFHPIHHDQAYARASGSPDIFLNILSVTAYVERFGLLVCPPMSTIAAIDVKLALPIFPGDELVLTGEGEDTEAGAEKSITVVGRSARGTHVRGAVRFERSHDA
ncbi:MaoC/PaaZ C-terminal domain-containing protein [Pandoraea vervacti]|nr:MaoC/PaaZ C-terminal domain-containing protein [Pandoraea vervacti]